MYKKFFGLTANPFNVNPDPRFLYATKHSRECLASLSYGITYHKGFILLTGEVGTGKTTILNRLLQWLRTERMATAFVFNPRLTAIEFLHFVLTDFGIATESRDKATMLQQLNHWLLERYRAGEGAVLIVDEAQTLSVELLEELRLLTNLETSTDKLLQIVLCGQPELEHLLKRPELRQLRQRITLRCHTQPLTLQDTAAYINRRMRIAGAKTDGIFAPDVIQRIYEYSQGIPRVINLLCEHGLIGAFADQKHRVSLETIDEIAREFELIPEAAWNYPQLSPDDGSDALNPANLITNMRPKQSRTGPVAVMNAGKSEDTKL